MNIKNKSLEKITKVFLLLILLISGCNTTVKTIPTPEIVYGKTEHYVRSGENLFRISKYYYDLEKTSDINIGVERIKNANQIDKEQLFIGQKLVIPNTNKKQPSYALTPPESVIPKPIETEPKTNIPPKYQPPTSVIPEIEQSSIINDNLFLWPVNGKIICNFGELGNQGIDIVVKPADEIIASDSGKVVFAGTTVKHHETIIIEHKNNLFTVYAHDIEILTKQGNNVNKGDTIAKIKSGTHKIRYLHFEIRVGSTSVNPLRYLSKEK